MLTSSGGVPPISHPRTYYPGVRQGSAARPHMDRSHDSVSFSVCVNGEDTFHSLVSRLSCEVRTATTTGDIHTLHQAVVSGDYTPDPIAIAGKILFLMGG